MSEKEWQGESREKQEEPTEEVPGGQSPLVTEQEAEKDSSAKGIDPVSSASAEKSEPLSSEPYIYRWNYADQKAFDQKERKKKRARRWTIRHQPRHWTVLSELCVRP